MMEKEGGTKNVVFSNPPPPPLTFIAYTAPVSFLRTWNTLPKAPLPTTERRVKSSGPTRAEASPSSASGAGTPGTGAGDAAAIAAADADGPSAWAAPSAAEAEGRSSSSAGVSAAAAASAAGGGAATATGRASSSPSSTMLMRGEGTTTEPTRRAGGGAGESRAWVCWEETWGGGRTGGLSGGAAAGDCGFRRHLSRPASALPPAPSDRQSTEHTQTSSPPLTLDRGDASLLCTERRGNRSSNSSDPSPPPVADGVRTRRGWCPPSPPSRVVARPRRSGRTGPPRRADGVDAGADGVQPGGYHSWA